MQRRQSTTPPPPPTRSLAQIRAEQARLSDELARAEALEAAEQRRRADFEGSQVIVPASPSPRKKRTRPDEQPPTRRPPPFEFRDSTLARPPEYTQLDVLRAAQPAARESLFASHESALPRSKFASGIAMLGQKGADTKSRKQIVSNRSLGFSSAATGSKKYTSEKASTSIRSSSGAKEKEKSTSREESAEVERSPAPRGGTMARHVSAPKPKPSAPKSQRSDKRSRSDSESEEEDDLDITDGPTKPRTRNSDGTLIEKIELGPIEHDAPYGDPEFETIEPNSGIRLKKGSREISHHQMQLHLSDRYHLSPALVYSLARQVTGTDNIEVDVDADFIVIGVLAWKDEPRFTKGQAGRDAKKYIRFTLVDLSTEAAAASGTGTLSLSAFAADTITEVEDDDGTKISVYKGGSGGAYEKLWKESVGAVVAVLNPSISKPPPIPGKPNVYSITPRAADSLMIIGRAKDLASCQAVKRDGKVCGSWCDARVNRFCEWHVQQAVVGKKASRPEMANVSSSMSSTAVFDPKKFKAGLQRGGKSTYNPDKKTGLLPDTKRMTMSAEGVATYVSAGTGGGMRNGKVQVLAPHALRAAAIQSGNGSGGYIRGVREGPTVEQVNRDRAAKERDEKRRKKEVKLLMKQDKGTSLGGEYVQLAAEKRKEEREKARAARELEDQRIAAGGKVKKGVHKKRKAASVTSSSSEEDDLDSTAAEEEAAEAPRRPKRAFSNAAVRLIGYDPTNHKDAEDEESKRIRLSAITSLTANRPAPKLSAPPGPKVRSGVSAPTPLPATFVEEEIDLPHPSAHRQKGQQEQESDDDDDLVVEGGPVRPVVKLVRLPPRVTKSSIGGPLSPSLSKGAVSGAE